MLKGLLFDFDGTIMDTNQVILESWRTTFEGMGIPAPSDEEIYGTFGEPLVTTMERYFPDVPVEQCLEVYRDYQRKYFKDKIALCPGMKEMLIEAKARGYKTALVTSRLKQTTYEGIEKFGLGPYLDTVITVEDTDAKKPDPAPCNLALERLGVKPEEAIMFGDTRFDILCGKNAGVKTALVEWAVALDADSLPEEYTPDYILRDPVGFLDTI